jgi:hypothetical protein
MDYPSFFDAINKYTTNSSIYTLFEHEYFAYNLLAYISVEELSVRKAVYGVNKHVLQLLSLKLENNDVNETKDIVAMVDKVFRIYIDKLKKP